MDHLFLSKANSDLYPHATLITSYESPYIDASPSNFEITYPLRAQLQDRALEVWNKGLHRRK